MNDFKKKILIIHSSLNGGGAEKVLVDMLSHFDYTRYEIDLLLHVKEGVYINSLPNKVRLLDLHIRKFPIWSSGILVRTNLFGMYLKSKVRRYFANSHYDTIISFMEGPPSKCHSYLFDKADKHITWVHINLLKNHWSKVFFPLKDEEKKFYQRVGDIVFVSQDAMTNFEKLFGFQKGRVIYNLIDRNAIQKKAKEQVISTSKFTVCNVGRLVSQKRQDRIIKIASILKGKGCDVDFWILGQGTLETQLRNMAKEMQVEQMVHFLKFQKNPYAYIYAADVFLLTSDTEGFPLVVSEALCLNKPIISTQITGPTEQLDNGNYGILTSFDVHEMADWIIKLKDNPTLLAEYQRKAEQRSVEYFDVNRTMQQIYEVI